MEVREQFINEIAAKVIMQIEQHFSGSFSDLHGSLDLLIMAAEESEDREKKLLKGQEEIITGQQDIQTKLDLILERISSLISDFNECKKEYRGIEEKLLLLSNRLQKMEGLITDEELVDYTAISQNAYENWDQLDRKSKKFIPVAEYLYSMLQKIDNPDFAPVIIELCRAIENEFLLKLFRKYAFDLLKRKGNGLNTFLSNDLADVNTSTFAGAVRRASKRNEFSFTLGQMNTVLSLLQSNETVQRSDLLKDFSRYIQDNMEAKQLLRQTYIQQINTLVNDYRNPSAHPELMDKEKARRCKDIMPERIDYFLNCVH